MARRFALLVLLLAATSFAAVQDPAGQILPLPDGTFFVRQSGPDAAELRYVQVASDGSFLANLLFPVGDGQPIAAGADQTLWFRIAADDGSQRLERRDENGVVLRRLDIPVRRLADGAVDGQTLIDVSPSGQWAVLRTVPASPTLAQLEWWDLEQNRRQAVLQPVSNLPLEQRAQVLGTAEVYPGWEGVFTFAARKDSDDVLAEVQSPCTWSSSFDIPDGDVVLTAYPTGNWTQFVVARPQEGTRPVAGTPLSRVAHEIFLLTFDRQGHWLREEELPRVDADGRPRDLADATIAFSPDGQRLLATTGDGYVDSADLVLGRWETFTVFRPEGDEDWAIAQAKGRERAK